jgi:hypothetical protein
LVRDGRGLGSDWAPLVQLLAEEVGLVREQYLRTLDLSQVETLRVGLCLGGENGVAVSRYVVSELLAVVDDLSQNIFLLGLEGKSQNLLEPRYQIFKLRSRGITRDLDAPVADWAGVLVFVLDFTSGNLQTLSMVPGAWVSATARSSRGPGHVRTTRGRAHTQSSCPPRSFCRCRTLP